jgi:hypothetical protein
VILRHLRVFVVLVSLAGFLGALLALPATSSASVPRTDAAGTVWLCRPGLANDPCTFDLSSTRVNANRSTSTTTTVATSSSKFDCFYIYPTASKENQANANLKVQLAEIVATVTEVWRFSQVCQIWAPMYRQRTVSSIAAGLGSDPNANRIAYDSVLSAWKDYLAHDNHGRPVIFIGHSQGAAMLILLLERQIDSNPTLRKRMVSAILLGGNVTVPIGKSVGGTFKHLPACQSTNQVGCVIAYSSFNQHPPADSLFGRPGQGVSLQSDQTATKGLQVLCTNPAALSGGVGSLDPFFAAAELPTPGVKVSTTWVEYPDLYTAACESQGGATWLQINDVASAGDPRPAVTPTLGPTWGLHLYDVNIALGNLVQDVAAQEVAYAKQG